MKIESIKNIKANPNNPRIIKDEKFKQLVKSIKDFPEMLKLRPIVVNNESIVLGGNMRLKACLEAGLKEVPIIRASELTEDQQREFVIKDNSSFGEWDMEQLLDEWNAEELNEWGVDVPIDYAVDEVLEAKEDNFEITPEEVEDIQTDIKLGDLIQIGNHRILCGDSTKPEDVERLMGEERADVAHNDPPYGMKKEKDGVMNDNLNFDALLEFNKAWIPLQFSYIKENGSWYCWGIDEPLMDVYHVILKPYQIQKKLKFRNLITWDKGNGQGQKSENTRMFATADEKCLHAEHLLFAMMGEQETGQNKDFFMKEWIPLLTYLVGEKDKMEWTTNDCIQITGKSSASHYFTKSQFFIPTKEHYYKLRNASKGKAFLRSYEEVEKESNEILQEFYNKRTYFDNMHDNMNNVWHIDRTSKKERESVGNHATPKPLSLCGRAIKSSCPVGGLVIDMFLGSGSTMASAHQLKRKCYGMELDPKYCQVIIDRMQKIDPTLKVL